MWVHADCEGIAPKELALIEEDKHPSWNSAYFCSQCLPKRMLQVFQLLIK